MLLNELMALFEYDIDTKIFADTPASLIIDAVITHDDKKTKIRFIAGQAYDREWDIIFLQRKNIGYYAGKTNSGAQFAVKDFIISCMKKLITEHNPKAITFTADKEDFGETRGQIYAIIMGREFPQFKANTRDTKSETLFAYTLQDTLQENLTELLTSKVNYDVTRATSRTFKTEAMIAGRLIVFSAELEDVDSTQWNIVFAEGKGETRTYAMTGGGAAFEVLSMVASSLTEFISRYQPEAMVMSAEGNTRATVYRKLLNQLKLQNKLKGYDIEEEAMFAGEHQFYVTKVR